MYCNQRYLISSSVFLLLLLLLINQVNLLFVYILLFCTPFSHCTAGHCEFLLRGINKGRSYLSYLILRYIFLCLLSFTACLCSFDTTLHQQTSSPLPLECRHLTRHLSLSVSSVPLEKMTPHDLAAPPPPPPDSEEVRCRKMCRRAKVIQELVQTEKDYLTDMELCVREVVKPLRELQVPCPPVHPQIR